MLPIAPLLPALSHAITEQDCILVAPPGAGKSTYLPLQLLRLEAFANQQIIMLQPRQVAVRSIAYYLASQLGESVGNTIGYQMRGEAKHSADTKLLIMTEGLLSARIQHEPELQNVALIIFDEFHERSVFSDIALGLAIEVQQGLREDLRLLVMSATLDVAPIKALMPAAALFESDGRGFPIEYVYRPMPSASARNTGASRFISKTARLVQHTSDVVQEAISEHQGHILVFLPGAAAINQLLKRLHDDYLSDANIVILPLYGNLSPQAQQNAIVVPAKGIRKIVVATNIAETSLTIDGVSIVIDSGLEKIQSINLARKVSQLKEQMISKASSIQRAGRAGRQSAGICFRLWREQQQQFLIEKSVPQIKQIDISPYLLSLLEWGSSFEQLPLIDKPSQAQIDYALQALTLLGFVDAAGNISSQGKAAAKLNAEPRLAKMILHALANHCSPETLYLSAFLAALIEGKGLHSESNSINIQDHLRYLILHKNHPLYKDIKRWCGLIQKLVKQNRAENVDLFAIKDRDLLIAIDDENLTELLLIMFPDRIGRNRGDNSFTLQNGIGVELSNNKQISADLRLPEWLVCIDLRLSNKSFVQPGSKQIEGNSELRLYAPIPATVMAEYLRLNQISHANVLWDDKLQKVTARKVVTLGDIKLSQQSISLNDSLFASAEQQQNIQILLLKQIRKAGLNMFVGKASTLQNRVITAARLDTHNQIALPDMTTKGLENSLEEWLSPYLQKLNSLQHLQKLDWFSIIRSMLSWEQQRYIDTYFPTHFVAPTGNKHALVYSSDGDVSLALRLQELYGLNENPSVGQGQVVITLSLLSPAHREIQKTQDLIGFWQGSYQAVQKEMKGRYPKHYWPDAPASAKPTTRTKKHM